MQKVSGAALIALALGCATHARADVKVGDEYAKKIKDYQTVQPLGTTPFGESINLYTGEVSFSMSDISVPGKGPLIEIHRSMEKTDQSEGPRTMPKGFGDWTLDLVQLETLTPGDGKLGTQLGGWKDASGGWNRCTQFGEMWNPPPGLAPKYGGFMLDEWWRGYQLRTPGGGVQELLSRDASNTLRPTTGTWPSATIQHWQIGCLLATSNGEPGDAFVALAPDGSRYSLDHLVYSSYEIVNQNVDPNAEKPIVNYLTRRMARMVSTHVVDRFNNSVDYVFTGERLTEINASDGRHVTIDWHPTQPLIATIHVMPNTPDERTWTYQYVAPGTDNRLQKVILPDQSAWTYDIPGSVNAELWGFRTESCFTSNGTPPWVNAQSSPSGQLDAIATITHPSGAVGTFNMAWRRHARTSVPSICLGQDPVYESSNPYFMSLALTTRTITGPGLSPMTWRYAYEPDNASVARFCPPEAACQGTAFVDVTDPANSVIRYTYSTKMDALEGQLLRVDYDLVNGVASKVETREYYLPNGLTPTVFPFGYPMGGGNAYKTGQIIPVKKTTIIQQGRAFTSDVQSFDEFVQPLRVVRTSTPAP